MVIAPVCPGAARTHDIASWACPVAARALDKAAPTLSCANQARGLRSNLDSELQFEESARSYETS